MEKEISFTGLLPFKPFIESFSENVIIGNDKKPTYFKIDFPNQISDRIFHDFGKTSVKLDFNCILELRTYENVEEEDSKIEIKNQITIKLLEKINFIIDLIRFSLPKNDWGVFLRNIGISDLLYYTISVEGKEVVKSTRVTHEFQKSEKFKIESLKTDIPFEWNTLTKALDLIEHGYYNEGLITGFSLLDYCVQKFLKEKMPNLTEKEKDELLRKIERQRLKIYLGTFLKLLIGESIANQNKKLDELEKLNNLRNKVIHQGKQTNYKTSINGLKSIHSIISFLNSVGADYKIPNKVIFL
ncbi:hypothetical protein C7377_1892 [Balneicella halophila]|uniref:Apea-like HEPN domain-containing protein n=1 Tax=Balneicella halophila TaxID=1537566 RepID=A0A7L4UM39_BALHA|nr:hypothetical protein [Balneicella halophila]PVX48806.1 hypothetical protein C7377_1892 [Balneicella halophila]